MFKNKLVSVLRSIIKNIYILVVNKGGEYCYHRFTGIACHKNSTKYTEPKKPKHLVLKVRLRNNIII